MPLKGAADTEILAAPKIQLTKFRSTAIRLTQVLASQIWFRLTESGFGFWLVAEET